MIVKNPIGEVFLAFRAALEPICGPGNVSMEQSATIQKAPYARIYLMGAPGAGHDLNGNEAATMLSIQAEYFADGEYAVEDAYDIDETGHIVLTGLGFRRTYGPELVTNIDNSIKRVVSRYRRIYTGTFETNQ